MKKTFTKEEKTQYFNDLRARWKQNKLDADQDVDARKRYEAISNETTKFSYYSFYFTLVDMKRNGFEGTPYIDTKTYHGWTEAGFKVKKGEKSKIAGITWMDISKGEGSDEVLIPKLYHLFHTSQVEPIQ